MIISYDRRPNANIDEKLQSLIESIHLALNEKVNVEVIKDIDDAIEALEKEEHGGGGGGGGSYADLTDKPQIEGVTLVGNKTYPELNLLSLTNSEIEAICTLP